MSGIQIKSGTGSGRLAGVTDDNRMQVSSRSARRDYYISRDEGKAFTVYGKINATDNNTNPILHFEYTGNGRAYVDSITFSSNSAAAKVEVYFDATYTSGGDAVVPLNRNRSSSTPASATCYHAGTALVMSTVAANEIFDVRLNVSTFTEDFGGTIILGKGDTLGIIGSVSDYTAADRIRVMIKFYEEEA